MATAMRVDPYIAAGGDWRTDVLVRLRQIVREEAPSASVSMRWSQPVWNSNGPAIYLRAFRSKVNVGFWRGAEMHDPERLLAGNGRRMKHLALRAGDQFPEAVIRDFVRQAVLLNRLHGSPTRRW